MRTILFLMSFLVYSVICVAQTSGECGHTGVNMSGGEYSWENFPDTNDLNYAKSKNITLIRLPVSWEKFQPDLNGPLDANQVAGIKTFLDAAGARSLKVIVDVHNYARYDAVWAQMTGWNLWSNGYVESPLAFPSANTYTFTVQARGSVAGGIWPNMEFRIDGLSQGSATVNSTGYNNYSFPVALTAGNHTIAVAFTNDGTVGAEDRNLYLAKINITAPSFSAVLGAGNMPVKTTGGAIDFRGEGSTWTYDGANVQIIGSTAVPYSAYQDFWTKLATEIKGCSGTAGYDIMNEPFDMPNANVWPTAAQAAVNGIRSVDTNTTIYVEGNQWASAENWITYNNNLNINDAYNKLVYEAHQYFDNGSGQYTQTYDQVGASPTSGVTRVQPFLTWLQQKGAKGFVGEFGVPDNDARWLVLLDNFLNALHSNSVSGTCWQYCFYSPGDPAWWHTHSLLGLNPIDNGGNDEPQMAYITKYAIDSCTITEVKNNAPIENIIKIYPNPLTTNFTVAVSSGTKLKNANMKIYDVCGKEMKSVSINNHETIVEKGDLKNGIYFFSIFNNDEMIGNGKLIVQ
ncbi:MAG: cellulase family glycosylhydrolase [Bacteroidales bacterium]|nr:cellulase family glycosylhydrolase [Bacteroidales bacterium]